MREANGNFGKLRCQTCMSKNPIEFQMNFVRIKFSPTPIPRRSTAGNSVVIRFCGFNQAIGDFFFPSPKMKNVSSLSFGVSVALCPASLSRCNYTKLYVKHRHQVLYHIFIDTNNFWKQMRHVKRPFKMQQSQCIDEY